MSVADVTGDGHADLLVGNLNGNALGTAHVYLGYATPTADIWNASPSSARIGPDGTGSQYGHSVATVGDLDGDGYADFVVATNTSGTNSAAHVYLGMSAPTATSWNGTSAAARIDLPVPDPGRCFGFRIY